MGIEGFISGTTEIMIMIVIVGIGSICCTIIIGLYAMNKIKAKNENNSTSQQSLIDDGNKNESGDIELEQQQNQRETDEAKESHQKQTGNSKSEATESFCVSVMDALSDKKVNEFYQLYLKSRLECFDKLTEFGVTDVLMEKLFETFEKRKQFEQDRD